MPRPRSQKLSSWDEFDETRPQYFLMGWTSSEFAEAGGYWSLVCEEMLTYEECSKVHDKGIHPFTKFLTVSRAEFEHLGIPKDFEASDYFSLEKQREVSLRNNSGKRE